VMTVPHKSAHKIKIKHHLRPTESKTQKDPNNPRTLMPTVPLIQTHMKC
jgi:hypothetical protein